jgi:hypothetical protein
MPEMLIVIGGYSRSKSLYVPLYLAEAPGKKLERVGQAAFTRVVE